MTLSWSPCGAMVIYVPLSEPIAERQARPESVLHLVASQQRRGAETHASQLSSHLTQLGWDSKVASVSSQGSDELGVEPIGADPLRSIPALWRTLDSNGPDVVVAHGSSTLKVLAAGSIMRSTPTVYRSIGDVPYWVGSSRRRDLTFRAMIGRMSAVVTLWDDAARVLSTDYGVDRHRMRTIPNAVDASAFAVVRSEERTASRERLGVHGDERVVVALGALSPEKGFDTLLGAIALTSGTRLLVYGSGPLEAKLRHLVSSRRLPVSFMGVTDQPRSAFFAADVLALPSRTEGQPAALIEAALCGIPVAAASVGGVPEMMSVIVGATFPAGDERALVAALDAASAQRDRALAARDQVANHFSLDRQARSGDELLRALVGQD